MEIRPHPSTSTIEEVSVIQRPPARRALSSPSSIPTSHGNSKMHLHSMILNPVSPIIPEIDERGRIRKIFTEEPKTLLDMTLPDPSHSGKAIPTPPISRQSSQQSTINSTDQVSDFNRMCRTLPPPIPQPPQGYNPPKVVFTLDNRAESSLVINVVQSFIDIFSASSQIQLPSYISLNPNAQYPIGTIMWRTLPDFYQWYRVSTGLTGIGKLDFELVDSTPEQSKQLFTVSDGDVVAFRDLKQHIWDWFWTARNANAGRDAGFKACVRIFEAGRTEGVQFGNKSMSWNLMNTRPRNGPPPKSNSTTTNTGTESISSMPLDASYRQLTQSPASIEMDISAHTSPATGTRTASP